MLRGRVSAYRFARLAMQLGDWFARVVDHLAPRELLEKALKIAQEKGDLAAELKIVEALRERGDS